MLLFQIIISSMLPPINYVSISLMDDVREILVNFAGLAFIAVIDNWTGMFFEQYLDTFYKGLTDRSDYLVFELDP